MTKTMLSGSLPPSLTGALETTDYLSIVKDLNNLFSSSTWMGQLLRTLFRYASHSQLPSQDEDLTLLLLLSLAEAQARTGRGSSIICSL